MKIDEALVTELVTSQFPQFEGETIKAVEPGGWDNRSFRFFFSLRRALSCATA